MNQTFADILRQLSADEVAFLDSCYDAVKDRPEHPHLGGISSLFVIATGQHAQFGTSPDLFELVEGMIRHAVSLGVIEGIYPRWDRPVPGQDDFRMTALGMEFVRASRAASPPPDVTPGSPTPG